jgi:hypothetical protein
MRVRHEFGADGRESGNLGAAKPAAQIGQLKSTTLEFFQERYSVRPFAW